MHRRRNRSRYYNHRNNPACDTFVPPAPITDGDEEQVYTVNFPNAKEARNYLRYVVPKLTPSECALPENEARIELAKKMVIKADRRNFYRSLRRKNKKRKEMGLSPMTKVEYKPVYEAELGYELQLGKKSLPKRKDSYGEPVTIKKVKKSHKRPARIPKILEETSAPYQGYHFEETYGPEGEPLVFKLEYQDDGVVTRVPTKERPKTGELILDVRNGLKAWRIARNRRRKIPVTKEMRDAYEASYLFNVRRYAAGELTESELLEEISKKRRQLSRKKRRSKK